jgi:hypothetical protein
MNTLYINYTKKGKAIADHEAEAKVLSETSICINGQDKEFQVSTENVINAVRCMKLDGRITCDVKIMFEGNDVPMNEYCRINDWPHGFCDYDEKWVTGILSAQLKKHKTEKNER